MLLLLARQEVTKLCQLITHAPRTVTQKYDIYYPVTTMKTVQRCLVLSVLVSHSSWTPFVKCNTIMSRSQCVMFFNRFVKWKEAEDGSDNDALCLPTIRYVNVALITASPKGTDGPLLCLY